MTRIRLDCDELCTTGALVRSAAAMTGDTALGVTATARTCGATPTLQTWIEREAGAVRAELGSLAVDLDADGTNLLHRGAAVATETSLPTVANRSQGIVTMTDPNDPNVVLAWDPNNPGFVMAWNRNNPNFVIGWNRDNPDLVVGFDQRDPTRGVGFSQSTGNAVLLVQNGGVWTPTTTNFSPAPTVAFVGGTDPGFSSPGGPTVGLVGGGWNPGSSDGPQITASVGGSWSSTSTDFTGPNIIPGPSLPAMQPVGLSGWDPTLQAQNGQILSRINNQIMATNTQASSGLETRVDAGGGYGIYDNAGTRIGSGG